MALIKRSIVRAFACSKLYSRRFFFLRVLRSNRPATLLHLMCDALNVRL